MCRTCRSGTSGFKPANYTLGIPARRDAATSPTADNPTGTNTGGTITINPGDTLAQIRDKINANASLQGSISASVVPEGSGQRLRIQQVMGDQLIVTQQGGTNAIDTLGLDFSTNGISQNLGRQPRPLLDDSSQREPRSAPARPV